jgi:choline transport protein
MFPVSRQKNCIPVDLCAEKASLQHDAGLTLRLSIAGQVYWTAALAPKGWAKPLSYFNAGCTTIAWIFVSSGSFIVSAEVVLASVPLTFPAYEEKYWHVFLVATAVALVCVAWNTVLFDLYPWLSKFLVVFINASGLYIIIGLLARTTPKASARTVFVDIINETGWDTAVVFFIGLIPGLYSVALFDLASHLTEELPNPRKQVPQIMMWTGLLAALSGVPMVIVCCFCTYDPLRLLTPIGGQAAFQIFVDGFRSFGMTMLAAVMFDIVWIFVAPSAILTTSRVLWSLARHKAWPLGKYIGYVQAKHQIPVGAVWLSTILALIVGLIGFGSTTVVNGCFGAAGVLFVPSYGMPFWLLLIRGRSVLPAKRYFNLGRWGPAVNVLAMGWQAIVAVFLCFPLTNPAQLSNMNWASAASCVGLVFVGVNWFLYAAKHFEPPKALYLDHDLDRAD